MLYWEIIAVCSEIHTKHINTLCGQNVELLNVKLVVHIVTTGLLKINEFIVSLLFKFLNSSLHIPITVRCQYNGGTCRHCTGNAHINKQIETVLVILASH